MTGHRRLRLGLDGAVALHHLLAEIGDRRPAAGPPAVLFGHDRLPEGPVHLVDQQPGAAIGHAHRPAGRGDRAQPVDQLQQPDLAGAEQPLGPQVDAQKQLSHRRVTMMPIAMPGIVNTRPAEEATGISLARPDS